MTSTHKVEAAVRCFIAGGELEQAIDYTLKELGHMDELLAIKVKFVESKKACLAGLIPFSEFANLLPGITLWLLQVIKPTLN